MICSKKYTDVIVAVLLLLVGCQKEPPLPQTPEAVVEQWQAWINTNDFVQAKRLSTDHAKEWVDWVSGFLEQNNMVEETPSAFQSINCQVSGREAMCACMVAELGEVYADTFYLKQPKSQWLVDIPEEELEMSTTIDLLFQQLQ